MTRTVGKKTTKRGPKAKKTTEFDNDELRDMGIEPPCPDDPCIPGPIRAYPGSRVSGFNANKMFEKSFLDYLENSDVTKAECLFLGNIMERVSYALPPHELKEVYRILKPLFDRLDTD